MAATGTTLELSCICFILILAASASHGDTHGNKKLYIVYMGALPADRNYSPTSHHLQMLQTVATDEFEPRRTLYHSYHRTFNGFAAWLTEQEREKLSHMKEVISIFPNQNLEFHTTNSWKFMGLTDDAMASSPALNDTIIGVLDSGIWPESDSFSDYNFGPVPKKWKGACHGGANFTCNRKIIGARIYGKSQSARDTSGHGTHTASTVAGNKVDGASFYDIAGGTAKGGVPSSRIAVYQICTPSECLSANMMAAFDDAVADGVDVITISIGFASAITLDNDPIAIGSFHAMTKNVVTVNSAGNSGSKGAATIYNSAPWHVSVGASTTDRQIVDKVVLADGTVITGVSINAFDLDKEPNYPLVYGKNFDSRCTEDAIKLCKLECLNKNFLKGKILMCRDEGIKGYGVDDLGAAGVIILSDSESSYITLMPGLSLRTSLFDQVAAFTKYTSALATIQKSETARDDLAPVVAPFSSRGPNRLFPEILKPDVVAPGVDILAAYPPNIPPSRISSDLRSVKFNFLSGTSMACPHAAGVIAYIKSIHPDWSPAALKSALMTTAQRLDPEFHPDYEFSFGSGHIDLVHAINPGLVYDITEEDYTNLICNVYDFQMCRKISGSNCKCPKTKMPSTDFNYPALTARITGPDRNINFNFTRIVTNVGKPSSTYTVAVTSSLYINISVIPDTLTFTNLNEKKSFVVSVTGAIPTGEKIVSGGIKWDDEGDYNVRSPIVVYKNDV